MPEDRIIARATTAGMRRLVAVPLDQPFDEGSARATLAPEAPVLSGLNAFLQVAQRQGAELVSAAREQAEQIARDARTEGHERGYQEGISRAQREVYDLLAFAETAVREVADTRARILEESEEALVVLAIDVAEKVLQAKLDLEPERVADVLRSALRKVYVRDRLQVVCNPADLALIEGASDELRAQVGTLKDLELIGDRRITRGGVIVRSPGGDVDATIESQLTRLRDVMLSHGDG